MNQEKLKKKCIFCGAIGNKKNYEHVLPKWLIKKTGDENRAIKLNLFDKDLKQYQKKIPFNSFKFKSCVKCNTYYKYLEDETKPRIEKLLNEQELSSTDFDVILTWFDKIRIGLWLGGLIFLNDPFGINPRFFIRSRQSIHDRLLFIYSFKDIKVPHLSFIGNQTLAFQDTPSVFGLFINNYFFLNASNAFLISKQFGLPYPDKLHIKNNMILPYSMDYGSKKINKSIFKMKYYDKGTQLFQPIIREERVEEAPDLFKTTYVQSFYQKNLYSNCKVFHKNNKELEEYPTDYSNIWIPKHKINFSEFNKINIALLKLQNYIVQKYINNTIFYDDSIKKKYVKKWKNEIRINNYFKKGITF